MTYWFSSTVELVGLFQRQSAKAAGTTLTSELDFESQIIGKVSVSYRLLRNLALVIKTEECLIKVFIPWSIDFSMMSFSA